MWSEDESRKARRARSEALIEAEKRLTKTAAPATVPAVTYAKAATFPEDVETLADALCDHLMPDSVDAEEPQAVKAFFEKNMTAATPFSVFECLWLMVRTMNARNHRRNQRLDELEARMARAEEGGIKGTPAVRWKGHWKPATRYDEGELVTDRGGLWLALRTATDRPGAADSGFKLIVKRGAHRDDE